MQVTREENHRKIGATAPGQMMTWPIALSAIFDGITKGMFTGKKLDDYIRGDGRPSSATTLSQTQVIIALVFASLPAAAGRIHHDDG